MRRIALAPLLAVTGCNWMRRVALAPLLAVTGCNWVFGLDATIEIDAAPVSELPPGPRTKLVWGIATTDGMPAAPGIDPVVEYKPIGSEPLYPAAPMIQVGDDSGLAPATYDSTDGSFEIPYPLRESPHRIVYTLPGESVPHEVQWALTGATLVVPRTTRADAPKPPANSGYTITPTGLAGSLSAPIAFTSGVFTATDEFSAFEQTGAAITFRYAASAKPLAGPSGAPQGGKGDWVLLTEWVPRGNTQTSVYGWALAREVDLVANMMSVPGTQPAWTTGDRTLSTIKCPGVDCLPAGTVGQTGQRLDNVLGSLGGTEDGIWLTRRLCEGVGQAVVLYTGSADEDVLFSGLDSGARGFALKDGTPDELMEALNAVAEGGTYVDIRLRPALLSRRSTERHPALSPREREIMDLLAQGLNGEQVAERLVLSSETVKTHIRNAMTKLEATTRVHAIAIALRDGYISPPSSQVR